jgi:hypothetical protein
MPVSEKMAQPFSSNSVKAAFDTLLEQTRIRLNGGGVRDRNSPDLRHARHNARLPAGNPKNR